MAPMRIWRCSGDKISEQLLANKDYVPDSVKGIRE